MPVLNEQQSNPTTQNNNNNNKFNVHIPSYEQFPVLPTSTFSTPPPMYYSSAQHTRHGSSTIAKPSQPDIYYTPLSATADIIASTSSILNDEHRPQELTYSTDEQRCYLNLK